MLLDKNTLIKVRNRDNGTVGYEIPEMNLRRQFQVGETKDIPMEELRRLSYIPGGDVMLRDFLVVENDDAVAELLGAVEPEYSYSEADIKKLLETGTIDQFLDTLDFAPKGVIEIIKDMSVKMELNDVAKRQAILEKTGFNVTKAIEINRETAEGQQEEVKTRRAAPVTASTTSNEPQRRTTAPTTSKYKVTSIGK